MANASPIRRQLLKVVEQIIPCVRENDFKRIVLAQPPMELPPDVKVTLHPGRPLAENAREHGHMYLHRWPAQRLHATRFPYLGFVLAGEVDWRIGITRSIAKTLPELIHCDYQVLTLPKQTFFLMPPGVPYSTGDVHWERPKIEQAQSSIFWLQILSSGVFCHICHTHHGEHVSDATLFVRDAYLAPIVELLTQELQTRAPHFEIMARTQLLALLLRVGRALAAHQAFESDADMADSIFEQSAHDPAHQEAVKRASSFIEAHLNEPLTSSGVAAHAYVSSSHLNRLVSSGLGYIQMENNYNFQTVLSARLYG